MTSGPSRSPSPTPAANSKSRGGTWTDEFRGRFGKDETDGPILVTGSATLGHALVESDLVDQLRLMVFPVAIDGGLRVLPSRARKPFQLTETMTFDSGGIVTAYERA